MPHPEAGPLREDGRALVADAVEDGGGERLVAVEDVDPVRVAEVAGEHHAAGLVAGADELEEQVGAARVGGQVPELVHDEQVRCPVLLHGGGDAALRLRLGQFVDDVHCLAEEDGEAADAGLVAEGDGQVGLARAGRADERDVPLLPDEVEPEQILVIMHNA